MIQYKIEAVNPNAHLFQIELLIEQPNNQSQQIYLPNWIPGSYMIRDFSKHIQWIKAEVVSTGESIPLEKVDKSTWQFSKINQSVKVTYQVYAWDLSVRGSHLDQTHGFFNGTSVFLAVKGQEERVCQVEIVKPQGANYQNWRVATGLKNVNGTDEFEFGFYQAKNYDELIDCPVEMADFTVIDFMVNDIPHYMVLTGRHSCDTERLKSDLIKICEHHLNFFDKPYPMERYVFMTYVLGDGFGGLEHRNSTALHCSREDLPLVTDDQNKIKRSYQKFLDLCSHEYFHTWNVKRIKPAAFLPYDTSQENYTELLWAFEGFTSYYDQLALVQCGVIKIEDYLSGLAKTITSVRRAKGRLIQSVTDSSFDAWNKYYKQDENAPNAVVSYYTKGAVVALCLDLMIRKISGQEKSLRDVMQVLWREYGEPLKGVENNTIQNIVYQLVGEKHQLELEQFFEKALYTTEDLPVENILAEFGVKLNYIPRRNRNDRGGFEQESLDIKPKNSLEIEYTSKATGVLVKNVYLDGAASKAGISAGDHLVALDGLKIVFADFDKRLEELPLKSKTTITGFRRDELMTFEVELQPAELDTAIINPKENNQNFEFTNFRNWLKLDKE